MNMFKPIAATTVKEYIDAIAQPRRKTIVYLHKFIREHSSGLKAHFAYNMIGYGSFRYTNYKKQEINWPIIALASQKNYISIYVCATVDGQYLAEKYARQLGRVSVGKSCIRFRRLLDIDLKILERLIKEAAKSPGLLEAKTKSPARRARPRSARTAKV